VYVYWTIVTHSRLYFFLKRFCHRLGMNLSNHGPISSLHDKFCKKVNFPLYLSTVCVRAGQVLIFPKVDLLFSGNVTSGELCISSNFDYPALSPL
jgi:hypothetical protein